LKGHNVDVAAEVFILIARLAKIICYFFCADDFSKTTRSNLSVSKSLFYRVCAGVVMLLMLFLFGSAVDCQFV